MKEEMKVVAVKPSWLKRVQSDWNNYKLHRENRRFMKKDKKALKIIKEYADHLSESHSDKVYVVTKDYRGDYVAFNRDEFFIRRHRGNFGKGSKITWTEMKNSCIYHTDQEVKK